MLIVVKMWCDKEGGVVKRVQLNVITFDLCVIVHQADPLLPQFHVGSHCCSNWVEFWIKDVNILLFHGVA